MPTKEQPWHDDLQESGFLACRTIELYCTYFDHNYLRKGLALYLSLRNKSRPERASLVVLALSKKCESILKGLLLPDLIIIPLEKLEVEEPRLLIAKKNRSLVEYYFTLTPWLIKAALKSVPQASRATYLDSDLYFHHSPKALWDEIDSAPMSFVEHRFSKNYTDKEAYGKFNVGWNTFDRSRIAQQALNWWSERCLEWCYDRIDGQKFADQGYLTILEKEFPGVHILQYPGINLAEYNLDNYSFTLDRNGPRANNLPVIYWHMHCLFEQDDGSYQILIRTDLMKDPVIEWAYRVYVQRLQTISHRLKELGYPIDRGNARYPQIQLHSTP